MEKISVILKAFLVLGYFAMALIQMFAIYSFFSEHWGWWFLFAGLASLIVAKIPILGGALGVFAANQVWDWDILTAILLFFWPIALYIPLILIVGGVATIKNKEKKSAS